MNWKLQAKIEDFKAFLRQLQALRTAKPTETRDKIENLLIRVRLGQLK